MAPKNDGSPPLPPLVFPARRRGEQARIARLRAEGKLRQIGPRLYTSVPRSRVEATVRQSWGTIVSTLFPEALLSHRSALEFRPTPEGEIFLTASTNREVRYPGLVLRFFRGPGALEDDPAFLSIHNSSLPRALLENLSTTRPSSRSKVVSQAELEHRLEQILRDGGEAELQRVRDRAREIAKRLAWQKEMSRLDAMVRALLGSGRIDALSTDRARATALGAPYDPACFGRLQVLFGELRTRTLPATDDAFTGASHVKNKAFFEAYFSNYIEGTRFEIEQAEAIVFDRKVPARRPRDAHDIVGTFQLVSDPAEMRKTPGSYQQLEALLRSRHRVLMSARPDVGPGEFKQETNRAGETVFVRPEHVVGTLRKGVELAGDLPAGISRAIYVMFLIAEVHPFSDGNGRIARIMMNAELVAAGASTIIIPTVYREDYLLALRALSRRERAAPVVDMLLRAQRFSRLDFTDYPRALAELRRRRWFEEPDEAKIIE